MQSDFKDRILAWTAKIFLFGILVAGACFLYPTYQRGRSLKLQEEELDRRLEAKREEIRQLSENQRRFRSERDFVELIARQNRRVYPGELVFVFEDK